MHPAFRGIRRPRGSTSISRLYIQHIHSQFPALIPSRFLCTRPPVPSASPFHHQTAHSPSPIATRQASTMTTPEPQFAEGVDAAQLRPIVNELQGQGWSLDEDRSGMKKTFYFRSYFKAVSFVNVIASQSATKKHHATMTVRIGSVDVHWTTHHPRGLTEKDTSMAQYCEEAAELMGAVQEGQGRKCGPA